MWIAILLLFAAGAGYLFLWTKRMLPDRAETRPAKKKEGGEIVRIGDFDLWVKVSGRDAPGTPIVFLPGGLGMKSSYLEEACGSLAEEHPLLFYDPRGCGRSESKAELSHYTWAAFAEELATLLRQKFPGKKVILAAHSGGCFILYRFLKEYPEMAEKIVLLSCLSLKYETKPSGSLELFRVLPPKDPAEANRWFSEKIQSGLFLGSMFADRDAVSLSHVDDISLVMMSLQAKVDRPKDYSGAFRDRDFPVLILTGNDRWEPVYTNRAQAEKLQAEFPNAKYFRFEHSGHFFFLEENERFLEILREFLRSTNTDHSE